MSDNPYKIDTAAESLSKEFHAAAFKAHEVLPDIFSGVKGKHLQPESPDTPFAVYFEGGANENAQKFVALIYSLIKEELPNLRVHICQQKPYKAPALLIDKIEAEALSREARDAIRYKLAALCGLARDEFKERIEDVDLRRANITTGYVDPKVHKVAKELLTEMEIFTQKAGVHCSTDIGYSGHEYKGGVNVLFKFNGGLENIVNVVGTIATKLNGLKYVKLEYSDERPELCTIVLKKDELEKITQSQLTKIKNTLEQATFHTPPHELRQKIEKEFDIDQHLYLLSGQPKPSNRSL